MQKKNNIIIFVLAALLLLLTACSAAKATEEQLTDDFMYSSDGNTWSTDGNVWYTSSGDTAYYTYATDGDYYYDVQYTPYATDGNVDAAQYPVVHVSSVDELLRAIAPETVILLAPGEYNLKDATPGFYNHCYFRPAPYGEEGEQQLVLCNLWDCVIASESGLSEDVSIVCEPRSASVLKIEDSYAVQLRGLTLGHTQGTACTANVIDLENSGSIYIGECRLFGCGTTGVYGSGCWAVTVADTLIHDCSYAGVEFYSCVSTMIDHVTFRNVGDYQVIALHDGQYASVQDCIVENNSSEVFLREAYFTNTLVNDLHFEANSFHYFLDLFASDSPSFWRCDVTEDQYTRLYVYLEPEIYATLNGNLWR